MSTAKAGNTHPFVYMALNAPFGVCSGFVSVTLAYLLTQGGVNDSAIAGLGVVSLFPQTWKVFWAPVVDTTLSSKTWYTIAAVLSGISLFAMGILPFNNASLAIISGLVLVNSAASSLMAMSAENLMAHASDMSQKGSASGWYQAGNLGGAGLGGGAALWIAVHTAHPWLPGLVLGLFCVACCITLYFIAEPEQHHRKARYLHTLWEMAKDLWETSRVRGGYLALLICFLPIGSGSAAYLWANIAGEWQAGADTVAFVNGALTGLVSAVGCLIGGYLCDRMDRKFAYALFGAFLCADTMLMAVAPRTRTMFVIFTLGYAFIQGLNYASFSAVVLEAIGRGAAATKYNLYASLANIATSWLLYVDGLAHHSFNSSGNPLLAPVAKYLAISNSSAMLWTETLIGFAAIGFFAAVSVATRPSVPAGAAAPA